MSKVKQNKLNKEMKLVFKPFLVLILLNIQSFKAQDEWDFENQNLNKPLFLDTRVINGHSVNVLEKKVLELRIVHRFGNIATNQSYRTLFGLDNSSDIRIGLEYGLTEKLMIGGGRSKGAGPFLELWDGLLKYNLISNDKIPLKITISSKVFFSSMNSSSILSDLSHFSKISHRFSYHHELLAAVKPFKKLTLQLSPGFTYRNLAHYQDDNLIAHLGAVARLHLFKKVSLLVEYYANYNNNYRKNNYTNPFGIGIEINTFGHVFLLNFINSRGIGEGQFLPYTSSNWSEGEFRFGFTIARKFNK